MMPVRDFLCVIETFHWLKLLFAPGSDYAPRSAKYAALQPVSEATVVCLS